MHGRHGLHEHSASTHSGVIRLFGQYFVSTGIVDREMGKLYSLLFELRQSGDYDDWVTINSEDILPVVDKVEGFLNKLNALIRN